jgi:hypothetical protein
VKGCLPFSAGFLNGKSLVPEEIDAGIRHQGRLVNGFSHDFDYRSIRVCRFGRSQEAH